MSVSFFNAIKKGDRAKIEKMLAADSKLVRTRNADGLSPIMTAAYFRHPDIADLLVEHTVTITIFEAIATGKFQQVILQLAKTPELVNAYSEDGFQPLGLATMFGHLDLVVFLIKAGAWINSPSRNKLHSTPLHSAVAGGYSEIVYRLLDAGADPNILQEGSFSPLHFAAMHGNVDMIRMLLEYGANTQVESKDGKTPLDIAVEKNHTMASQMLRSGITKRFRNLP